MNILTNKQTKSYDRLSRYSSIPIYYNTKIKKMVYGTTKHLNSATEAVLYTVKENDTYDSIALSFYNNPTYFWVICDYNRVIDPFVDPEPQTILYIPVISDIEFE